MTEKIVVIDFSGTLIKPFVAEEANLIRYKVLDLPKPSKSEIKKLHATKEHYNILKNKIEDSLGITDSMELYYHQNHGQEIKLSGKEIKTSIMTDLFRIGMFQVAKKNGQKIFPEWMAQTLQTLKERGYKLAIVSGIRTDIITGLLSITKFPVEFDYICGQDPILSFDDNQLLDEELAKEGEIVFIIGDKLSDLEPAKKIGAKAIFAAWGHPSGGEEELADFVINSADQILEIIK